MSIKKLLQWVVGNKNIASHFTQAQLLVHPQQGCKVLWVSFLIISSKPRHAWKGAILESQCRKKSRKTLHNPLSSCPGGNLCGWRGLFPNPSQILGRSAVSSQLPAAASPAQVRSRTGTPDSRALPISFVCPWPAVSAVCTQSWLMTGRWNHTISKGGLWRMDVASEACDSVSRDTGDKHILTFPFYHCIIIHFQSITSCPPPDQQF